MCVRLFTYKGSAALVSGFYMHRVQETFHQSL
jgi:hypothetical protein